MEYKYFYNDTTDEIIKIGATKRDKIREISKEEFYAIEYARDYASGVKLNFESVRDFAIWCSQLELNAEKTKWAFVEMGHPMDFVTKEDILEACKELDTNEENPHFVEDYKAGKITIDSTWELYINGGRTDTYLI